MPRLSTIRRGVKDIEATAAFFAWLLEVEPDQQDGAFGFRCGNGTLLVHGDTSTPVAIGLCDAAAQGDTVDPDGVPVSTSDLGATTPPGASLRLDHVRLNCADLALTTDFYRSIGFQCTWSGGGGTETFGLQAEAADGATWLHLSCDDGYVSLSQADWQDYGRHTAASGPPRFIHIGLAVASLDAFLARLDDANVPYLIGNPQVGRNVYLNDPDGDERGNNIEVIEYIDAIPRSGFLDAIPAAS